MSLSVSISSSTTKNHHHSHRIYHLPSSASLFEEIYSVVCRVASRRSRKNPNSPQNEKSNRETLKSQDQFAKKPKVNRDFFVSSSFSLSPLEFIHSLNNYHPQSLSNRETRKERKRVQLSYHILFLQQSNPVSSQANKVGAEHSPRHDENIKFYSYSPTALDDRQAILLHSTAKGPLAAAASPSLSLSVPVRSQSSLALFIDSDHHRQRKVRTRGDLLLGETCN